MMKTANRKQQFTNAKVDPTTGLSILFEDAPGGARKIRCPTCGGFAAPSVNSQGKVDYTCSGCGTVFRCTKM